MTTDGNTQEEPIHEEIIEQDINVQVCPICQEPIEVIDMFYHVFHTHPTFLAVWTSLMNPQHSRITNIPSQNIWSNSNNFLYTHVYTNSEPNTQIENITYTMRNNLNSHAINTTHTANTNDYQYNLLNLLNYIAPYTEIIDYPIDDPYEVDDYDFLSDLCDRIGYHTIGVNDINECAPIIDNISSIYDIDKCPICLEEFKYIISLRKINICDHIYCAPCIETWLKNHKTCPVCKQSACTSPDVAFSDHTSNIQNINNFDTQEDIYSDMPDLIDVDDTQYSIYYINRTFRHNINTSETTMTNMEDVD